jgi:hypothetical protein
VREGVRTLLSRLFLKNQYALPCERPLNTASLSTDENESELEQPDFAPMIQSVKYLVNLAEQKAAQWSQTDEPENQDTMLDLCRELKQATLDIAESLKVLQFDRFNKENKEKLLFACRYVVYVSYIYIYIYVCVCVCTCVCFSRACS